MSLLPAALQVAREMEAARIAFELARLELQERAKVAEQTMLALLRSPLESWKEHAVWQLAMCEFAVQHIDDAESSAMQLQVAFRAACESARHPSEVPRLRGAMEIDALALAFASSAPLQEKLHRQLEFFKRYMCSCGGGLGGFCRFRRIDLVRGETLLALMRRTHLAALQWRPPGRSPAEQLAVQSKDGVRYRAEWRRETGEMMIEATGRTLSLRGASSGTRSLSTIWRGLSSSLTRLTQRLTFASARSFLVPSLAKTRMAQRRQVRMSVGPSPRPSRITTQLYQISTIAAAIRRAITRA